jgi:hypothetical protein
MAKRVWNDGVLGNTPLSAARLSDLEDDLEAAMLQLARDPAQLFAGAVTNDEHGAPISAVVEWPDGVTGTYSGTPSVFFPGSINAYTVTRAGSPTVTFTQPAITREGGTGYVTNRPPITVT